MPSVVHDPGKSRETPCLSKHTWHFAPGDYQFEVGFLPLLWPNTATKMQKIASLEQAFVRVASGVYLQHAKPCNHNQVPISNTAGWIPLLFYFLLLPPARSFSRRHTACAYGETVMMSPSVEDTGSWPHYFSCSPLYRLELRKKKQWSKALAPSSTTFPLFLTQMRWRCDTIIFPLVFCRELWVSVSFYFSRLIYWQIEGRTTAE